MPLLFPQEVNVKLATSPSKGHPPTTYLGAWFEGQVLAGSPTADGGSRVGAPMVSALPGAGTA